MKTLGSPIILILILVQGLIGGLGVTLYKLSSNKNFYIEQCLANNQTDYSDIEQLNQCINSFEIYKDKENKGDY